MIQPCRVVKLGGSHFTVDSGCDQLSAWLRRQTPMNCVIVVGGGVWADAVRSLDQQYGIATSAAHWMAVRAMSLTSWLLVAEEPQLQYVDRFEALQDHLARPEPSPLVFDTLHFLQSEEPHQPGTPLPHGWHVTSDSIAARVAQVLGAAELVLLKPKPAASAQDAITEGLVDDYLEVAATGIERVRIESIAGRVETLP